LHGSLPMKAQNCGKVPALPQGVPGTYIPAEQRHLACLRPHLPPALHHKLCPNEFPSTSIKCFCYNLGIITTLTDMQNNTVVHPNDTTNDDCNVYMEILDVTTCCVLITLMFLHVKGHQDTNKHCPLTVIEQLNVNCNQATKNMSHPPHKWAHPLATQPCLQHNCTYGLLEKSSEHAIL